MSKKIKDSGKENFTEITGFDKKPNKSAFEFDKVPSEPLVKIRQKNAKKIQP